MCQHDEDLYDQWVHIQRTTQWRFAPSTHVVAALDAAVAQYVDEGGSPRAADGFIKRSKSAATFCIRAS